MFTDLLPVFITFYGIHSTASSCRQREIKLGKLTEATGITKEWIFFIIVDSSRK